MTHYNLTEVKEIRNFFIEKKAEYFLQEDVFVKIISRLIGLNVSITKLELEKLYMSFNEGNFVDRIKSLEKCKVLKRTKSKTWEVNKHFMELKKYINQTIINDIYNFWANFFFSNFRELPWEDPDKSIIIIKVIKFYQLAKNFNQSSYCLTSYARLLKFAGYYKEYISLARTEMEKNSKRDNWIDWHYAYCCFVTGNYPECHRCLTSFLKRNIKKYVESYKTEDLNLLSKHLQLYVEVLGQMNKLKEGLFILLNTMNLMNASYLEWQTRFQFFSALSALYQKLDMFDESTKLDIQLLKDIDIRSIGEAVCMTRMAIICIERGENLKAYRLLSKSTNKFKNEKNIDKRGVAWCSLYLAICSHKLGYFKKAEKCLKTSFDINKLSNLASTEYYNTLKIFCKDIKDKNLSSLINGEIIRVRRELKENSYKTLKNEIFNDFVEISIIIENITDLSQNVISYFTPIGNAAIKIKSKAIRSVINRAKKDSTTYLRKIFELEKNPVKIFNTPFYTKMITECLKKDATGRIFKNFIKPHLSIINNTYEKTRIHFARAFEYSGHVYEAMELLNKVENKNFDYYNILGNCYKKKDMKESQIYYNMALNRAKNNREKGIVYNNLAYLIYNNRNHQDYNKAKDYCVLSSKYNYHPKLFPYPIYMLILIEIDQAPNDKLLEVVYNKFEEYKIQEWQKKEIHMLINDRFKKYQLRNIIKNIDERTYNQEYISQSHTVDKYDRDVIVKQLLTKLNNIVPGEKPDDYCDLCAELLEFIFGLSLSPVSEREANINDGRKRIDILYLNSDPVGFLEDISKLYHVECTYIAVECKNYSSDISNPELDQLGGRLNPQFGMFGLLLCRKVLNMDRIIRSCRDYYDGQNKCIIVLEDSDFKNLIEFKRLGKNSEIRLYMQKKMGKLIRRI